VRIIEVIERLNCHEHLGRVKISRKLSAYRAGHVGGENDENEVGVGAAQSLRHLEALLNAIVHRDYAFSGSTLISIFEDRIEFVTIGGLVKGITLEDVKLGVSVLRNQHLANIFYRLRLIEAYGTGILKINESYDEHTVKPVIETTNNAFKITLPNSNYQVENQGSLSTGKANSSISGKKDARIATILKLCQDQGSIVRTDVEKALDISQSTAILLLREMVDEGTFIKKGKGKNLRYYENK
jgi:ATP-dependent DNA helicase RecG